MSTRDLRYHPSADRCRRCGTALVPGARFCPECGLDTMPAAPPAAGAPRWLLPALVVGGGGLALIAGIVLALALDGPAPVTGASSTAGATASQGATATPTGSAEPSVTPAPSATPDPVAVLANRSIVEVTAEGDRLRLRVAPGENADELGTLGIGARLFVIGAPEEVAGYRWYRIAHIDGPFESSVVDLPTRIGWVASSLAGPPWLEPVEVACGSPTTVADLAVLLPLERLHCFGRDELVLTGILESRTCGGCESLVTYSPAWLAGPDPDLWFTGTEIRFRPAPDAIGPITEVVDPMAVRVRAHLEDPAAASCRVVDRSDGLVEAAADVVLNCRTTLVITEFEFLS